MSYFSATTEIELSKLMGRPVSGKTGPADPGANVRVGLGGVLQGGGRGSAKAGSQRALLNAVSRTAKRAPEVMVKVTGRQSCASHTGSNMVYIAREGRNDADKFELEDERGERVVGAEKMYEKAREWEAFNSQGNARRKGDVSRSMTFSMPSGVDGEKVKEAARAMIQDEFAGHKYVMALHTDTNSPHVHFTYAIRNSDTQKRHYPKREDLQRYREKFAAELRSRGIEANATSRKARLAERPTESIEARKMREAGKPLDKGGRKPMSEELRNGVLSIYAQAIHDLHDNGSPEATEAASSLALFVADKALSRQIGDPPEAAAARQGRTPQATERSEAGHRPPTTPPTDGTSAAEGATGETRPGGEADSKDAKQLQELQDMLDDMRAERELREMLAEVRAMKTPLATERSEAGEVRADDQDKNRNAPSNGNSSNDQKDMTTEQMRERLRDMHQEKDRGR